MPNWKKLIVSGSNANLNTLTINSITAGTADYNSFLVSDNGEIKSRTGNQLLSDIGGVDTSGTPVNNQLAIFTDANTIEGTTALTYDGTTLTFNPGFVDNSIITANTTGTTRVFGTTEVQLESDLEINIGDSSDTYLTVSPSEGVIKLPQLGNGFVKQTAGELTIDSSTYSTQTLTLGSDNQIPFMNGTTDFEYSSALTYNDNPTSPTLTIDGTSSGRITLSTTSTSFDLKANNTNETFIISDEIFGEPFFVYDKSGGDMLIKIGDSTGFSNDTHIEIDNVNTSVRIKNSALDIGLIDNAITDTDKFLVSDSGTVEYRTGTQLISDIGAVDLTSTQTISGNKTFSGPARFTGILYDANTDAGTAGQLLSSTGTGVNWVAAGGSGTVTSVATAGSVNGLTLTGGPITTTGTITLGGTLANIANTALTNSTVSYGGIQLSLGGTDATPAFDLSDATNYPTSALVGTITNSQLAGSIANSKLVNDSVSFGGVSLDLGGTDATPAFDLSDATNYPTSALVGTITNAQLAGSITNSKLSNSTVSYGGVQLSLGGTDATPAFNLSDATAYPGDSSLTTLGTVTSGNVDAILPANALNSLKLVKALSVETIGASENILLWYTTEAITISSIHTAVSGTSPSVSFNVKSGSSRTSLTVQTFTSDQAATSTTGESFTINTANIAANRWIALTTSAATALTNLDISITCIPQ